jgi:hypothetical protein
MGTGGISHFVGFAMLGWNFERSTTAIGTIRLYYQGDDRLRLDRQEGNSNVTAMTDAITTYFLDPLPA